MAPTIKFTALLLAAGLAGVANAQESTPDCYNENVKLVGHVLENFDDIMKMDFECHLYCQYEPDCASWTYSETDSSSLCTLFSKVEDVIKDSFGFISGPKDCDIEGPTYVTPTPTSEAEESPDVPVKPEEPIIEWPVWNETDWNSTNFTMPTPLYTAPPTYDTNSTFAPTASPVPGNSSLGL